MPRGGDKRFKANRTEHVPPLQTIGRVLRDHPIRLGEEIGDLRSRRITEIGNRNLTARLESRRNHGAGDLRADEITEMATEKHTPDHGDGALEITPDHEKWRLEITPNSRR